VYTIKKGDTLFSIGRLFNCDAYLISALNDIDNPDYIKPGEEILVPSIFEVSHEVTAGETIWQIADIYGILPQQILLANDIWYPKQLAIGRVLSIPGVKASVTITSNNSQKVSARDFDLVMEKPTTGVLTSLYGMRHGEFHTGIDISNAIGTPIKAALGGQVIYVGWKGNYGRTVIIDHKNGFKTLYGHNHKTVVNKGQWVQTGDKIALMGNTGRSTGPHLHFEVHRYGKVVDPRRYIYTNSFANDY